jgi:thiol-disulfide isomerase/thioredoxin
MAPACWRRGFRSEGDDVASDIDLDRRRFVGAAAMTIAAARLGISGTEANDREPRQWTGLARATEWLNSPRLTATSLQGKVVLVDFWTYTCINWLRTLPYVRAWADKYKQRLVVIGVHTPEFSFEHDVNNVRRAVHEMRIDYPVAVDNDYAIWRAFDNNYWPALYLLDPRGRVRYHHFGEGEYEQSEKAIQRALAEAGSAAGDQSLVRVDGAGAEAAADCSNLRSSENYLGFQRTENFASPGGFEMDRQHRYRAPGRLALNHWALAGEWTVGRERVVSTAPDARIVNRFHARDLHLVMGPSRRESRLRFRVSIDGQPPGSAHGVDVDEAGNGMLAEQRLYQLIRQAAPIVDREMEIEFLDPGAEAFSFTFG